MPPEEADPGRLFDILAAAQDVVDFLTGRTFDDFTNHAMLRAAVERKILIIGEAASKLSKTLRDANPQVPWDKVIRTRHVFVHDYDRLVIDTVWRIATVHVPELIPLIRELTPPPPPDPEPGE